MRVVPAEGGRPARLELGHVDSALYMAALRGQGPWPPTVFPGGERLGGEERQAGLRMTDRPALLAELARGTQ